MNNNLEGSNSNKSTHSGQKNCNVTEELKLLQLSLNKQHQKNKLRYQNLKKQGTNIGFQLYSPVTFPIDKIKPSNYEYTKIQLMSSVDRLFKEAENLTKIEMKNLNDKHQQLQLQQNLKQKISNSYLFLRKTFIGEQAEQFSAEDRLDRLNKIIGTLKGGAQQILKQSETSNKIAMMKQDEQIMTHPLYEKLKQSFQRLTMKSEDDKQKLEEQIQSQQLEKQEIKKQNNLLRKQVHGFKIKIRSLEMEVAQYLNKVNTLTEKLFQNTHKKIIKEQKGMKYVGADFQMEIKTNKQLKLNFQNQLVKRTLEELEEFIEGYVYSMPQKPIQLSQAKGSQNIDNTNDMSTGCAKSTQKTEERKSLGKITRRNLIGPGDPQNITKVRFTRTSTLVHNNPRLEAQISKQGYIRKRTDSYRQ